MWCPEGYEVFGRVWDQLLDLIADATPWTPGTDILPVMARRHELLKAVWNEFSFTCPSLSVVSPSGVVLRITGTILCQRQFKGAWLGYSFLNSDAWVVDATRIGKTIQSLGEEYERAIALLETPSAILPDIENEVSEAAALQNDEKLAPFFENFQGWAVTCRKSDVPTDLYRFDSVREQLSNGGEATPQATLDRRMQQALRCINQLGLLSKERVRRHWFAGEKTTVFLSVWEEMGRRRAELAVPGPRPPISDRDIESFIQIDSETNSEIDFSV